jgi:hypothetical protein
MAERLTCGEFWPTVLACHIGLEREIPATDTGVPGALGRGLVIAREEECATSLG